jgi:hypothetical protein
MRIEIDGTIVEVDDDDVDDLLDSLEGVEDRPSEVSVLMERVISETSKVGPAVAEAIAGLPAPVVNVQAPVVNVPAPVVKVNDSTVKYPVAANVEVLSRGREGLAQQFYIKFEW